MPIKVTCNSCGGVLHAPDDAAGKRGRCPTCGMILSIPADAPRVAAETAAAPAATYGIAPPTEPLAFPKPPAFGMEDGTKSSAFGTRSSTAPGPQASRLPPDPRRFNDPFAKPAKTPQVASAEATARKWARVDRGLGLVRWGIVCITLGVLAPTVLAILEQNGLTLPDKNPGYAGAQGLSFANEIKVGLALVFFLLGGLLVVLGRFRVAAAPRPTGCRSIARAAALSTFLAYLGFAAMLLFAVSSTINGVPPKLLPQADMLVHGLKMRERIERYLSHLFLVSDDFTGQAQRFGAVAFLAGGLIAELWFLGTLSRLAVYLRSDRAIGRVNRFAILAGTILLILAFAGLAYDFFGKEWTRNNIDPKWDNMAASARITARAAATAGIIIIIAFIYTRSLRGIRTAIREANAN